MAEQRSKVAPRAVMLGSLIDLVPLSAGWKELQTPRDLLKTGLMVLMRPKGVSWL